MKWKDCKITSPSIISEITRGIVLYSIENSVSDTILYDWTEARWNGIEWRTDDFGLTNKKNLFDNPKYKSVAWAEVETPENFKVYKD